MTPNLWSGRWNGRTPVGDVHQRSRKVISPSGGIMRGKFPSRKNGRMVHHEGLLELDAIYLLEASPHVAGYREQPTTITYPDGDRIRRYTPDFEVTLSSGELIWVEIKPSIYLHQTETQHKLKQVSEHLKRRGQFLLILTEEVLRKEPRQANVRTIFHRAKPIRPSHEEAHATLVQTSPTLPASIQQTTEILEKQGVDPYSLLMAGLLRCDLNTVLTPSTQITYATEADDGWFWLAQEHGF